MCVVTHANQSRVQWGWQTLHCRERCGWEESQPQPPAGWCEGGLATDAVETYRERWGSRRGSEHMTPLLSKHVNMYIHVQCILHVHCTCYMSHVTWVHVLGCTYNYVHMYMHTCMYMYVRTHIRSSASHACKLEIASSNPAQGSLNIHALFFLWNELTDFTLLQLLHVYKYTYTIHYVEVVHNIYVHCTCTTVTGNQNACVYALWNSPRRRSLVSLPLCSPLPPLVSEGGEGVGAVKSWQDTYTVCNKQKALLHRYGLYGGPFIEPRNI